MVVSHTKHSQRQVRAEDEGNAKTVLDSPFNHKKIREEKQKAVDPKIKALKAISSAVGMLTFRLTTMEGPVNTVLNAVKVHAERSGDPALAQKAEVKFQRLFGSLISAVVKAKESLKPLTSMLSQKLESGTPPTFDDVITIARLMKESLPVVQSSLRALDPKSHQSSLAQEMAKQKQFLKQLEAFKTSEGAEGPNVQAKLSQAISGAQSYLLGLEKLADPDFEDRVSQSVERALKEEIPELVRTIKVLGNEFRSTQKTASSIKIRKRLQRVAKRIVLLTYLRSKS